MNLPLGILMADGPVRTGSDFGKASPIGLLIVVLLVIALFGLVWSMNRHLRRARAHFARSDGAPTAGTHSDGAGAAAGEPSGEPGG